MGPKVKAAGLAGALSMVWAAPQAAYAWGPEGHKVIANVAFQRLSKPLQAKFDKILQAGQGLAYTYTDPKTQQPVTCHAYDIDGLANWADCVRYGGDLAVTYDNHFDDIPYCPKPPKPPAPVSAYCGAGVPCATKTLPDYIAQLSAAGTSDRDRAMALAFVVHIIGDLHQPLHTITNSGPDHPKGDKGGNDINVKVKLTARGAGRSTTLHKVWDGDVVGDAVGTDEAAAIQQVAALAAAKAAIWKSTDPKTWAAGSHGLAVRAYDQLSPAIVCGVPDPLDHVIDKTYFDGFRSDVRDQLGKASVRLGDVLTLALAKAP